MSARSPRLRFALGAAALLLLGGLIGLLLLRPSAPTSGVSATTEPDRRSADTPKGGAVAASGIRAVGAPMLARGDGGLPAHAVPTLATWGTGPGQVARKIPEEGNPEAPMSFSATPGGGTVVLDQVNGRLVRFKPDGRPEGTVPVTQQAPQEVVVAPDGTTLVLDRLADKSLAILKDDKLVNDLPIEGKGIPEGGGVTGVFVDGKGVYLEREHGALVLIGDTDGQPNPDRPEIPGRPSRDGKSFLAAALIDHDSGQAYVTAVDRRTAQQRFRRDLALGAPLLMIVLLDSDKRGTVYLGALLEPQGGQSFNRIVCLSGTDGATTGTVDLPANSGAEETFRDFAVLDDGGVLFAQRSDQGIAYARYDCR
jgi:hypothetical protein